jgi:hypothetical protein
LNTRAFFTNRAFLKRTAVASIAALSIAAFFVGVQPASAATPAHRQSTAKQITSGQTNSVAFGSANAAGSLIVAYVIWSNTGTVTVTDSRNSFTPVAPVTRFSSNQWSSQVFYAKNIGAGANTVTATFGTPISSWAMIYIHEYSGVDKVAPLDGFSTATGTGAAMNSGPMTVTGTNDLIFGAGASNNMVTAAGAGFTTRSTLSGDRTMDSVVSGAGTYSTSATQNGSVWVLHAVAFKAGNAGTPPPTDTTPPSVSVSSPANHATVAGTIPVNANASDNVGVRDVEFYVDGVSKSVDQSSPYSYSLNTTTLSEGAHTLTAKATDTAGNSSSASVSIDVDNVPAADTTPPVRANGAPTGTVPAPAASLTLTTNEPATCRYATVAGTPFGSMSGMYGTNGNLNHSATLTGLAPGQNYSYHIRCQDTPGNQNTNDYTISFATSASAPPSALSYDRVIVDPRAEREPWMKCIGDLNGDHIPDLVVSGRHGKVVWYQTPGWTERVIAQTANSESGCASGDIDGDGDLDIVIGATWHENVSNASSWISHALPNGANNMTHDIVIADINSDGKQDISMRGESQSPIHVYLQASPSSWNRFTLDPGIGLNGLDVADVNLDGRKDVVIGGRWMENPGGAIASAAWPVRTFGSWVGYGAVKVIDINGGRPDIVLSASEDVGKLSWFEQHTNGTWTEHVVDTNLASVHGFIVSDVDLDGLLDITASEYYGQGRLTIYRQTRNAAGTISWQPNLLGTDRLHNIQAADLNGDCRLDFFGAYSLSIDTPVIAYRSNGGNACGAVTSAGR